MSKTVERLIKYLKPEKYDIMLDFSDGKDEFRGEVEISGEALGREVRLNAEEMKINDVSVFRDGEHLDFKYEHSDGELVITNLTEGEIKIRVEYIGKVRKDMKGAYESWYEFEGKKRRIITTQFESHAARYCFPSVDEPEAKAQFHLTLKTRAGVTVLSNDKIEKQSEKNGVMTTSFRETPKMSTYLVAFVIGDFQKVTARNRDGVVVSTYGALNQPVKALEFANETACRALELYKDKFGDFYPFSKLDQVALPDFAAGAMENWGLVTYREACLLVSDNSPLSTKRSVATTVTHELAHQWFGNLVTMKWWDELWLNESFANMIERYAVNEIYPEYNAWQDFFLGDCVAALFRDALPYVQPVQVEITDPGEIDTIFDPAIVYAKGARLLFMLARRMGFDAFFRGLRDYFKKYQYSNTTGEDLWGSLQPYAEFEVGEFMEKWIREPGFPEVYPDGRQREFKIGISKKDNSVWSLPKDTKDDMTYHYVLYLSDEDFFKKLSEYNELNEEQKIRLLLDRELLARTDEVESRELAKVVKELHGRTDFATWDLLASYIADLAVFMPRGSEKFPLLQEYVRKMIPEIYEYVDSLPETGEAEQIKLTNTVMSLAEMSDYEPAVKEFLKLYNDDLMKIDGEKRTLVLRTKLEEDEKKYFKIFTKVYQETADADLKFDLLAAMADVKEDENIDTLVSWLSEPEIVRPQDHLYLYIFLARNYRAREKAFNWLYENFDYVRETVGEEMIGDYPKYMAGMIRTEQEKEELFEFFKDYEKEPVFARIIKMAKPQVEARLRLIEEDTEGVIKEVSTL